MPRTTLDLVPTAARSLQTILDISDHVSYGTLRKEVARTVKGLFDLLAWSDGNLDREEIDLLDRLCAEVPGFGELCESTDLYEPTDPTFGEIPKLLTAVVEHDRHSGERLAPVLVAALETMGYAIIGAGGAPVDIEKAELHTYVNGLRNLSRLLTKAAPIHLM
jgi:hypothetical protein